MPSELPIFATASWTFLRSECEARKLTLSGLLPRPAHLLLLAPLPLSVAALRSVAVRLLTLLDADGDDRFVLVRELFVASSHAWGDRAANRFRRLLGAWAVCSAPESPPQQHLPGGCSASTVCQGAWDTSRSRRARGASLLPPRERDSGLFDRQARVGNNEGGSRRIPGDVSLVLSHCMIGSGDMSLFSFLARSARATVPLCRNHPGPGKPAGPDRLRCLFPDAATLGIAIDDARVERGQRSASRSDVAVSVTLPWSYGNGDRPGAHNPSGRLTVLLCGSTGTAASAWYASTSTGASRRRSQLVSLRRVL